MTKEKKPQSLKEYYDSLDKKGRIDLLNTITTICFVSHNTVLSWLHKSRVPGLLIQKTISKKLGRPAEELFN